MFGVWGAVVALYADLVVLGRWELAFGGCLKFAFGVGSELHGVIAAVYNQPKLDGRAWHGLEARDYHHFALDQFLYELEYGFAVVVPGYSGLLVLVGWLGCICYCYVNGVFALCAVGRGDEQGVFDIVCDAGLDSDFEGVIVDAPSGLVFAEPCPAGGEFAVKGVFEESGFRLDNWRQDDIAVTDGRVVALQVDGAWLEFIGPHRSAGAAEEGLVVDNRRAVELYRYMAVEQGDVEILPLARFLFCVDGRGDSAVNSAHVVPIEALAVGIAYLDFVDASQVDSAVAALGDIDLELQIEIFELQIETFELLLGSEVAVGDVRFAFLLGGVIDEDAVFDGPAVGLAGVCQFPCVFTAAVKQRYGFGVFHFREVRLRGQGGNSFAGEFPAVGVFTIEARPDLREKQIVALDFGDDLLDTLDRSCFAGGVFAFDVVVAFEGERIALNFCIGYRYDASSAPEDF